MPLKKNQIIPLHIEALTSEGSGVGHYNGEAVFVPATAPGDRIRAKIVKDCGRYAYGIVDALEEASPGRCAADCPVAGPCGGCCYRHITYETELAAKRQIVQDALTRIGGIEAPVLPVLPSPEQTRCRNKAQYPVGIGPDGALRIGFYAGRSHRLVPCDDCLLQPPLLNEIARRLCALLEQQGVSAYDEAAGTGLVRHLYLRRGWHSGQVMVCLVCNGDALPDEPALTTALTEEFPQIKTILLNTNTQRTNVILGARDRVLYGPGIIEDSICGVPVRLGPFSFYQVNTAAAELLYRVAAQYADLQPGDRLLDLYCGMGTIGLSMADQCGELIGVEVVPEAVESARANALRMGEAVAAKSRFFAADAGEAAARLAQEGLRPDVVILDPPRKGCDAATREAVLRMGPRRIVMVSCNPATAARDLQALQQGGYRVEQAQPVDLFPRTKHVETVCLLSKLKAEQHIEIDLDMSEMDLAAAESKATYEEIQAWVLEKFGLHVSHLYIAQVKRKCGIIERECYNHAKSEGARQPQCPPEKETAIRTALEHFGMIPGGVEE